MVFNLKFEIIFQRNENLISRSLALKRLLFLNYESVRVNVNTTNKLNDEEDNFEVNAVLFLNEVAFFSNKYSRTPKINHELVMTIFKNSHKSNNTFKVTDIFLKIQLNRAFEKKRESKTAHILTLLY